MRYAQGRDAPARGHGRRRVRPGLLTSPTTCSTLELKPARCRNRANATPGRVRRRKREYNGETSDPELPGSRDSARYVQLIADFSGLNIVRQRTRLWVASTLRLQNVPWDQALRHRHDHERVLDMRPQRQRDHSRAGRGNRRSRAEGRWEAGQGTPRRSSRCGSEFIQVNYAKASELARPLEGQRHQVVTIRPRAGVANRPAAARTTLLVSDTPTSLGNIRRLCDHARHSGPPGPRSRTRVVIVNDD